MILWLASLTALASYTRIYSGIRHYGDGEYFGYYYNASSVATAWRCGVAAAVFAAFELLFLATLLFFAYSYHHHVAGTQPSGPLFRTSGFGTASVTKDEEHAMTDTAPTSPSTPHAVPHHGMAATANGEPSAAATNPPYPTGNAYEVPPPPLPTGPARDSAVSPLHTGHHAPPPQIPPVQTLGQQDSIRFDQQPQPQPEPATRAPKPKGRYVYQPVYVPPEQLSRRDSKTNIQALPDQPLPCSCNVAGPVMEEGPNVRVESTSNVTTPTATPFVGTPSLAVHPPLPLTPDETTSNGGDHYPSGFSSDTMSPRTQAPAPQQHCRRPSLVPLHAQQQQEPPSILYQEPPKQQQRQPPMPMPHMPNHARSLTLSPHSLSPKAPHHPRSLSITHPLAPQPPSRSASPNNNTSSQSLSLSPYPSRPGMPYRSLSALSSPTPSARPKSPTPNQSSTNILTPYAPLEHPFSPKPPGHMSLSPRIALVQRRTTSASSVATLARFQSVDERDEATGLPRAPPGVDFEASGALAWGANRGTKKGMKKEEEEEGKREEERRSGEWSGEWSGEIEVEGVPRGVEWMVCRS
ncbi:hypothetical protein IWZ01DRAFT_492522 [Phyllosticta capitalensis]